MATFAVKAITRCDHMFIMEGKASAGGLNFITDSLRNIPTNLLIGLKLLVLSGTGAGQTFLIVSNIFNTITLQSSGVTFDATTVYRVIVRGTNNYCKKCLGNDEYWDTSYSGNKTEVVSGIQKLAQDVQFVIMIDRGSSIYNQELGSALNLLITADVLDDEELFPYTEQNVNDALAFIINNQMNNQSNLLFDSSELVGQIKVNKIERNIPETTQLDLTFSVTSQSGTQAPITSPLLIR